MVQIHRKKHICIVLILAFTVVASFSYAITVTKMYDDMVNKVINWNGTLYELKNQLK